LPAVIRALIQILLSTTALTGTLGLQFVPDRLHIGHNVFIGYRWQVLASGLNLAEQRLPPSNLRPAIQSGTNLLLLLRRELIYQP